ncbi:MAG TPA: HAMP domain-containing sensor histidine kinase [Candidatus Acidoferrales bacterium]
MALLQLRTQLVIAALVIISAFTGAILVIVQYMVRSEIRQQAGQSVDASVRAFKNVETQRDAELSRTASLLAELPPLMALMTTEHAPTIQDASQPYWQLAGSDLFALANTEGNVLGFHIKDPGWTPALAQENLKRSLEQDSGAAWWFANGQLYRIVIRPIAIGPEPVRKQLGVLVVGYQVDSTLAEQLATVSGAEIVLSTADAVVASTLSPERQNDFKTRIQAQRSSPQAGTTEIMLGSRRYETASVLIGGDSTAPIRCYVFVSLDRLNLFQQNLNRLIFILGISAVLLSTVLLGFVARTITRPLDNLVSGVRALSAGDYTYSIQPRGSSEVAELAEAFSLMRAEILASHEQRIVTERITAVGRAASSISHDLRHYLAAIVANAEFLFDAPANSSSRAEIYNEIKMASDQMTDLLDSLRELVRGDRAISPEHASLDQVIRRGANSVLARPEWRNRTVSIQSKGDMEGVFDPRKMERVFFNLILNACEATSQRAGAIQVDIESCAKEFVVRVADQGPGIPPPIHNVVFDPFVSAGKPGGTGLGLAIVNKIVRDHDGSVVIEKTSEAGTVLLVTLPRVPRSSNGTGRVTVASVQS